MDRWMDGWMDRWMDGWVDRWMDGWVDGWVDGWMDGWIDTQIHRRTGTSLVVLWLKLCTFTTISASLIPS